MTTGRNFDEILRVLDSMQLTVKHKVATPANWQAGDDVIIVPSVSNEEAEEMFPKGWETVKPYLRVVAQPKWGECQTESELPKERVTQSRSLSLAP